MCTRMVTLCAEPNTYSASTVHSDGRTIHVPNLIRGEKKYHPYCLKQGNKLKKVKFTKPGISCFDFSVICVKETGSEIVEIKLEETGESGGGSLSLPLSFFPPRRLFAYLFL